MVSIIFQHCLIPFTMSIVIGFLKSEILNIYLTTFFRFRNFENTSAMRVIFFLKVFKILSIFQKRQKKIEEKLIVFFYNPIWSGCVNLFLLRRENLWQTVNVFTNSPKILHVTKRDFFQFNCLLIDQYIWKRFSGSDLNSVCVRLLCCFSEGRQKQDFLDIYLTAALRVRNFEITAAMRVIFFLKIFKILSTFQKWLKKVEKKFSLFEIITSQLATSNCFY